MSRNRADAWEDVLQRTLSNAVQAPYYRRRFGNRWRSVRALEDLTRLPLLDKRTAIRHQRELIVGRAPPGFGIASSGTSRTDLELPPLNILTTEEETEATWAALPKGPPPPPDPHPGWTLVTVSVNHGLAHAQPGPDELVVPWMYDANALYMLEAVLSRPQPDGRRVTAMRISTGALKTFTAWLLQRGKDPRKFGVRLIGTNSFRVSPFWRALISEKFGAQVIDNYSLSEFASPAPECPACGWLHFAWPPIIYEVLDVVTSRQKRRGAGRLVLTTIHPFVQKMPLIRYDTGDVVELGPLCRVERTHGLRFLGRLRRGLVVKEGEGGAFVVAPSAVQDVLDGHPEVERVLHPCAVLGIIQSRDIGLPRWTVELERTRPAPTARLRFEVRFDPLLFEAKAAELARTVRGEVLSADRELRRLLRAGGLRFEVELAPPGTLRPPNDKYA